MTREAGKGSKQRPTNQDAYSQNWDLIFRKEKAKFLSEEQKLITELTEANEKIHEMELEMQEQCRLLGAGGSREARLMAENEMLRRELAKLKK